MSIAIASFCVNLLLQIDSNTAVLAMDLLFVYMCKDTTKIRARIKGAEHEDMLTLTDGYMTAWFLYHLQGDEEAGTVFFGGDAEILHNANWQDVQKNR